MGSFFLSSAPVSDVQNALMSLQWEAQGEFQSASETDVMTRSVSRGNRTPLTTQQTGAVFGILTGGAVTLARDATTGLRVVQITSGVGTRTTRLMNSTLSVNSGAQFGLGNIPAPRRFRRYTAGALIRVPVRGTAILEFGAVFSNGFLTFLGTSPAFVLSSDPGVNGGAWTPRVRQVDAGGITTLASTGRAVNGTQFELFEIRYTEGPTPLLELLLNSVVVAQLSGIAAVPTTTGTVAAVFGFGCSAVAGTTLEWAFAHYSVEEL